jgi:ATP-dependent DNA helicase DinG
VRYLEPRARTMAIRAAPVQVAPIVRDLVLVGRAATVLTSATLAVDRSFEYVKARLGLEHADTFQSGSGFDYARQALLYLPDDLPDPRHAAFIDVAAKRVAAILEQTHGRAFVLFTSYSALRAVHEHLSTVVSWPLLVQGSAPQPALLRDFRATPNAVLLATSSFWQGVDVAGEALTAVIIDRLPFASPGDPIVSARITAIEGAGGRPFDEYQLPQAALTLRQGLGRLIRTSTDRGVMAILDPRLTRMPYGRRILAALPPAPRTRELADIARFLTDSLSRSPRAPDADHPCS